MRYFLDIEASSLHDTDSYPVSCAIYDAERDTVVFDTLIKPADGWDDWDENAELFYHGIPREAIVNDGLDVESIVLFLNANFAQETLICDSPYDIFWMERLCSAAKASADFQVLNVVNTPGLTSTQTEELIWELGEMDLTHIASEDAKALAETCLKLGVSIA